MKQRLGVFLTRGYLDSVPSLHDCLILLSEKGYSISVYTPLEHSYLSPERTLGPIKIIRLPKKDGYGKISWLQDFLRQAFYTWHNIRCPKYLCFIGVDAEGLILATIAGKRCRRPIIYYSLEILCTSDKNSLGFRLLKALERACHQHALFTIIQDEARADLLMSENSIKNMPYIKVPNAPLGGALARRSTLLRDKLGIAHERLLVLHAGSLSDWTMAIELAEEAQTWPDEWVLVFQCRERPKDHYGQRLMALADNNKVFVNAEPVPFNLFPKIISSADIGIAMYRTRINDAILGKNLYTIGKSSGKIAQYLQYGIPIVTSNFPSSQFYINKFHAGISVSDIKQVRHAIEIIKEDYLRYSSGAIRCFQKEFDLESNFAQVLAEIKDLELKKKS